MSGTVRSVRSGGQGVQADRPGQLPAQLNQQDWHAESGEIRITGQHLLHRLLGVHGVALSGKVGRDGTEGPGTWAC